jgi:small subunit ribosomal protein S25e
MGGKKKRSLKQIVKTQEKKKPSKKQKRAVASTGEKKSIPGITTPNLGEKFESDLKKMKVITPYSVASRFDLRLSVARDLLRELEHKGMITFVSKSRNLRIYKPAK